MTDPWKDTRDPNVAVTDPSYDDTGRFERPTDVTVVGTIDITPSWSGLLPFHIGVLDGTIKIRPAYREQTKQDSRTELRRMAMAADRYNELAKAAKQVVERWESGDLAEAVRELDAVLRTW